ncbi:MAG TPA: acyl-CoA dehydrogenase family protein [Actinomycetota bacterium]|nr:acyl-CoA dehydrogenase family protein [Actinomycetota bacterium]
MSAAYQITEDQELFRKTVRELAEEKIAPRAAAIDEADEYPHDMHELLVRNDLMAIGYPEEFGGSGGPVEFAIFVEEISRVSAGVSLIPLVNRLGAVPVMIAGSPEQKKELITGIVRGERQMAYCLTEPGSGSDAAAMRSRAVRDGDEWVLNGTKRFITNAGVADTYTYFAVTDPDGKKGKNITAFVVRGDKDGFELGRMEHKMGIRGSPTREVILNNYVAPADDVLGDVDAGFTYAMQTLDFSRPTIGAQALGIAQGAFDHALAYAKDRQQFNQPIASFQGIQFMLADMAMAIEASRLLVYKAANKVANKEADVAYWAALAKCYASDTAMKVTTDAVQILGGYGYVKEFPVERMMRDAKITQIYEGTNQIQRVVIARALERGMNGR